jgi:uncharacterized protein YndB with AHSA1/START domain
MIAYTYHFETVWKIKAPVEQVWNTIYNSDEWPDWWRGMLKVKKVREENAEKTGGIKEYTWGFTLTYKLSFKMETVRYDYMHQLEGRAWGDLEGRGLWTFTQQGDTTTVVYYWNVQTNKKWMNQMAWLLKPVFKFNHDLIMRWGAKGLTKRLDAKLIAC